jgi:hypothetical protein
MSRTDKHRPAWVQASEHGTEGFHRHELFGAPVIVRRPVRDARGRVSKVEAPVRFSLASAITLYPPTVAAEEVKARYAAVRKQALLLRSRGAALTELIDGPITRTQTLKREVVIGHYAEHCTLADDYDRDGRLRGQPGLYAPCERELDAEDRGTTWGRSRGARAYGHYRDRRNPTRRRLHADDRRLTVLADTGSDPEAGGGQLRGRS